MKRDTIPLPPASPKETDAATHVFKRIDTGIARVVECSCGYVISGYSWRWIDEQIVRHHAEVAQ